MTTPWIPTLQIMKTLTLIVRFFRLDNQSSNLEPNLWFILPEVIFGTARPQLWNHRLIFVLWILDLRVDPRWILGLMVLLMIRSLLSLQMQLRNQRPVLTSFNWCYFAWQRWRCDWFPLDSPIWWRLEWHHKDWDE